VFSPANGEDLLSIQLDRPSRDSLTLAPGLTFPFPLEAGGRGRALRTSRRRAQRAVAVGRTGLIWLTAYLFAYRHASSTVEAAGGAVLVTGVWLTTLYALGPG